MAKQVAEIFIETLVNAGVKRVYGVVGDSLNGLTDVIRKSKQIEWLHVRHEEVAAFAAGAEAHLTGKIAVCAGSCGPGNLHLINGLYDCHRNRLPILAIAAQIPSYEIGSGYFQETHPEHLFKDCSYYCELISQPEQMPRVLGIAMRTALTKRGVAVVVIPVHNLELRGLAMTHPLKHAESSARKCGGKAEDYLRVHNWFDESKAFLPDFQHRALRHHAEGIFLCDESSVSQSPTAKASRFQCATSENRMCASIWGVYPRRKTGYRKPSLPAGCTVSVLSRMLQAGTSRREPGRLIDS